jgi:ferritin-like metal-binding protein YciE
MTQMETLMDVLSAELRDLYSAEQQIVKALPKVVKKCSSDPLRKTLSDHLKETENQVKRLEQVGEMLDIRLDGEKCDGMAGLLTEGEKIIKEKTGEPALVDSLIIGAAQRVEHYEIAGYGTARTIAEALGFEDVAELLQQTLDEEEAADERLNAVSEEDVLPQCIEAEGIGASNEGEEEEEEEELPLTVKKGKGSEEKRSNR